MSSYTLGLKKYFKGQLRDAVKLFSSAGKTYFLNGDIERAREAFYSAGKAIYELIEDSRWRGYKKKDYVGDYLLAAIYFKLAGVSERTREILTKLNEVDLHRYSLDLRHRAIKLLLQATEQYNVVDIFEQTDDLIMEWNNLREKEKQKLLGAYVLLHIVRSILMNKKSFARLLWERNEINIMRTYKHMWDELSLFAQVALG